MTSSAFEVVVTLAVLMFIISYNILYYVNIMLYNIIKKKYYRVTIYLSRIFHLVYDWLKSFDIAILIAAIIIKSEKIYKAETHKYDIN